MDIRVGKFVWNAEREKENIAKHGVNFTVAAAAFTDPDRKMAADLKHRL